MGLGLSRF